MPDSMTNISLTALDSISASLIWRKEIKETSKTFFLEVEYNINQNMIDMVIILYYFEVN